MNMRGGKVSHRPLGSVREAEHIEDLHELFEIGRAGEEGRLREEAAQLQLQARAIVEFEYCTIVRKEQRTSTGKNSEH